jgi:ribonuclease HI
VSAAAGAIALFTDGACKGNPGPGGWGVLIVDGGVEEELFGGERDTTNNRMELTAVIRGLEHVAPGRDVDVWTDSQYVKNGIETWIHGWKRNGWKTAEKKPVKNAELWRALEAAALRHRVRWHWVRGHNAHVENERADALANRGVDAVRAPRPA